MTHRLLATSMTLALAILIAGCGFLKRTQSQFFSLQTIPAVGPRVAAGGVPIGIGAVELPPGLDRRGIVVRQRDQRLEIRETEQWADSLESMVLHTVAFDLAGRVPEGMVILPGQIKPAGGVRTIDLIFEELAAGPDRSFVLDVRWILREPGPGRPETTFHERIEVEMRSLGSANIASATSRALATLADRIAARLAVE